MTMITGILSFINLTNCIHSQNCEEQPSRGKSKCKELLLVSTIDHEYKVYCDFLKGKGGCSSQVQCSLGT